MAHKNDKINPKAIAWLERLSRNIDSDPDIIDSMPIADVRRRLKESGLDVEGFHKKLAKTLAQYKPLSLKGRSEEIIQKVETWFSELWQPAWVGVPVSASDIPDQKKTFKMDNGEVTITCNWRAQTDDEPAHIYLKWNARISLETEKELWIRFISPDTYDVHCEIKLGRKMIGGEIFTVDELGFDPSREKWAISVILSEV
jgi:hypothetical protein